MERYSDGSVALHFELSTSKSENGYDDSCSDENLQCGKNGDREKAVSKPKSGVTRTPAASTHRAPSGRV